MSETISQQDERRLMRLLHGEMGEREAAHLRRRLESEPALATAYRRLERVWNSLEAPPPAAVPPGFARRTAARILEQSARSGSSPTSLVGLLSPSRWALAPASMRLAAALALVLGVVLGVVLGLRLEAIDGAPAAPVLAEITEPTTWESFETTETGLGDSSLAEQYWLLMDSDELPAFTAEEDDPAS
jgi:ferric-dicitrate binding protein FerR (iron transport regulator)